MAKGTGPRYRNRLLTAISAVDAGLLRPHLEPVVLELRADLQEPKKRIEYVYFVDKGIASVVAVQANGARVEVGLIGPEGMTGSVVVLGDDRSPYSIYMQIAGEGQRISVIELRKAMKKCASLHSLLLKFVQTFMVQTAHTAVANARGQIDERLARWILMAHDRVSGDTLRLTHESIALMLGVTRPGVTLALQSLAGQGLIRSSRGQVVILNRKGIEGRAGELYGVPEAEFRRLIG